MTVVKHELKQGGRALAVWTGAIGFLIVTCVALFPEMKDEMDENHYRWHLSIRSLSI